jgi:hypothetical protein
MNFDLSLTCFIELVPQVDAQGEVKKSKQEMDRLLQMVKVSQEEQSAKDKLIRELQE